MNKRSHPLNSVWRSMWRRCTKPQAKQWEDYGGRGISVCDRWRDFWAFVEDMGPRPEGYTLDRVDNDGDYTPENCRWATRAEQLRNRRNTTTVVIEGTTYKVVDLADKYGIDRRYIVDRAARGLPYSEVVQKERHYGRNTKPAIRARIRSSKTRTHCKRGHELTAENVHVTPQGARTCRLCRNLTVRQYRARKRRAP